MIVLNSYGVRSVSNPAAQLCGTTLCASRWGSLVSKHVDCKSKGDIIFTAWIAVSIHSVCCVTDVAYSFVKQPLCEQLPYICPCV